MTLEKLRKAVLEAPVVIKDGIFDIYPQIGSIHIDPSVLEEVTTHIIDSGLASCDKFVAIESMSLPLAVSLTLRTGKPFTTIRKRSYGFPGEISVEDVVGFDRQSYFINGLQPGDRVVLLDDVMSTGKTLEAIVSTLQLSGVKVERVMVLIEKRGNLQQIADRLDVPCIALCRVKMENGRVVMRNEGQEAQMNCSGGLKNQERISVNKHSVNEGNINNGSANKGSISDGSVNKDSLNKTELERGRNGLEHGDDPNDPVGWLKQSLLASPVICKGTYQYFVHPLTDGIPLVEREMLEMAALAHVPHLKDCEVLVTAEAMGIPIATAISLSTGHRVHVIRKRSYGLDGEVEIMQETGYSKGKMFMFRPPSGKRMLLLDDVLSTGGTLGAIMDALSNRGDTPLGVVITVNKMPEERRLELESKIGTTITTLVDLEVVDGVVKILPKR